MKKILLITVILLLQSLPSFGSSPNGKQLICYHSFWGYDSIYVDKQKTIHSELGIVFSNNSVTMNFFSYNDVSKTVSLIPFPPKKFSTTKKKIIWNNKRGSFQLDRKELFLVFWSILGQNRYSSYWCNIYSHKDYSYQIDKLRNKHKKFINEKIIREKNKI